MFKIVTISTIAFCLSGCMTTEQMIAQDDASCRSWGVRPGTSPYVECRALLSQQHAMEDMQRRNNMAAAGMMLLSR